MADVPAATPATTAVVAVATEVLPELQVPPVVASVKVVVNPAHIVAVPEIAAGEALTVTTFVATHPEEVE